MRTFRLLIGLAALLTIPTWLLTGSMFTSSPPVAVDASLFYDTLFSRWITGAWSLQYGAWGDVLLPGVRYLMDGFLFLVIALMGWVFWKGERCVQIETAENPFRMAATSLLVACILIWVVPFHSQDMYGYINRGVAQVQYGVNPYVTTLSQIPYWHENPLFHAHWVDNPAPFGVFYALLTKLMVEISGGQSFFLLFILFKSFNWLCWAGVLFLSWQLMGRLNHPQRLRAFYCIALNPLLLLHVMANGHNDVVMLVLLLFSLWSFGEKRFQLFGLPFLMLSVLTKYATLLFLPGILWLAGRTLKKSLLQGVLFLSVVLVLGFLGLYIPQGVQLENLKLEQWLSNAGLPQHSLHSMLYRIVFYAGKLTGQPVETALTFRSLLKPFIWSLFVGVYGFLCFRFFKCVKFDPHTVEKNPLQQVWPWFTWAMVLLVLVASPKFNAWYLVSILPLMLMTSPGEPLFRLALLLSFFQLLAFTPVENIHILNYALLTLIPLGLSFCKGRNCFEIRHFAQFKKQFFRSPSG